MQKLPPVVMKRNVQLLLLLLLLLPFSGRSTEVVLQLVSARHTTYKMYLQVSHGSQPHRSCNHS